MMPVCEPMFSVPPALPIRTLTPFAIFSVENSSACLSRVTARTSKPTSTRAPSARR